MTEALTDATTTELAENNLVAVPRNEWAAMQGRMDEQDERIDEERQARIGLQDKLTEYRAENEQEKAEMKQRIGSNESELENQAQNIGGAFAQIGSVKEDIDSEDTTPTDENQECEAEEQRTPMETILSLPDDMARRELNETQYRGRKIAERIQQHGKKVMDGLRLDSSDMRTILTALDRDGKTIYRQQVKRVLEFFKDITRNDEIIVDKRRGRNFVIFTDGLVEQLATVETDGNIVRYGENGHGLLHTG